MATGYIIWGFLAPRFAPGLAAVKAGVVAAVIAMFALVSFAPPALAATKAMAPVQTGTQSTASGTLTRIKEAGRIRIGYRADARPFSFRDESGQASGYSVALAQSVADAVKTELGLVTLSVEWVPVTVENRFQAVRQGEVDLLCGADTETLARRKDVAFSTPIFPGGIGALLRKDASSRLKDVLSGRKPANQPTWRASAVQLLQVQTFSVVGGTTAETWLNSKLGEFQVNAKVVPVGAYEEGVQRLLDRKSSVMFGDRAILLDAATRNPKAAQLMILDRLYTYEAVALALPRGDEEFRLTVDRALARLYASGEIATLYGKWFGKPDDHALTFFRWNTLPD